MEGVSVDRVLRLPVRLHGILLGRPVDVVLSRDEWRAAGFEVRCGDGSRRFVPFATARIRDDEIAIGSALMLLEEVEFYRARGRSFRELLGTTVAGGSLRDVRLGEDGFVVALVVEQGGELRALAPERTHSHAA